MVILRAIYWQMLNVFEEVGAALKQMLKQRCYIEGLVDMGTMHNHLRDVRGGYYGGLHSSFC